MSELYFRLGEMKGFTAIDLADKKVGYANPIRELIQNSLDASSDTENNKCEVNIYIEDIKKSQIPHIKEYEKILKKAIDTAKAQKSFNDNSKQRIKPIQEELKKENLTVLMFSDNGIGMKQDQLEGLLTGGVSIKGDEKSGGSFGVGNLSSYSLSALRYVLYATKYKDDSGNIKTLFTGSPILAGYRDGEAQRSNRGRIVTRKPENEQDPKFVYLGYPEGPRDFIKPKMDNLNTGTIVVILGLSEDWDEDAEYAIVSNFFHAIAHDALSINIHTNSRQEEISDDKVESLILKKKEKQQARGDNILSGRVVHQAWQAVKKGIAHTIKLSNKDKVQVCIESNNDMDTAIVVVRNGMVIARHDSMLSTDMGRLRNLGRSGDYVPFTAVIDIDKDYSPNLFKLVRDAESPYHNRLQSKLLDRKRENKLKELWKELSEKIKDHLEKIERGSFKLPLFTMPDKAKEAESGGNNKSSGQNNKAEPILPPKKPPKPKPPEPGEGKKGPKPIVFSRNLKSKNAVRYTDKGDKWEVKLRITPNEKIDARDDVYLSMCLAEDNDNEKTEIYLDFKAVQINGKAIEIPDFIFIEQDGEQIKEPANKSQVKLGQLQQSKPYNIIADVEKPDTFGNIKVALLPIFGLKQRNKNKK